MCFFLRFIFLCIWDLRYLYISYFLTSFITFRMLLRHIIFQIFTPLISVHFLLLSLCLSIFLTNIFFSFYLLNILLKISILTRIFILTLKGLLLNFILSNSFTIYPLNFNRPLLLNILNILIIRV